MKITKLKEGIQRETKVCACCGKQYPQIPMDASAVSYGYFYNCTCNSTLFWKNKGYESNNLKMGVK